jgi:tripartite ATP-independent transporter DctP family solute receptor
MKKAISILLVAVMLIAVLAGCGSAPASSAPAAETKAEPIVIKISHQNASTHPIQLGLLEFKRLLEEKSGGTITCDIYDSAVLGNDTSNMQQVIAGSLDAAMIMGAVIWQGYDGRANVEELPFLFDSYEKAYAAYDGEFGKYLAENVLESQGGHVVNFWDNGFRHFTNNIRPVTVPADMKGIKFRTADSEIRLHMFECCGTSAITMAFSELYSAMQQGTVDGQENPLSNIVASSFFEVQKYLSLSGHIYNTSVFFFSDNFWNSLTDEQKAIIEECSREARDYTRKINQESEAENLEICKNAGMEVNEVDKAAFIEAVQPVWEKFEATYGTELVELAQKYA